MIENLEKELSSYWPDSCQPEQITSLCSGYELLGIGGSRIVIAGPDDDVWKIAWRESGLLACEIEYRLWNYCSDDLCSLLCPALELSPGGSLRQRRVQPVSYEALGQSGLKMIRKMAQYGITDVAINCGLLESRVVVYDYSTISPELQQAIFS